MILYFVDFHGDRMFSTANDAQMMVVNGRSYMGTHIREGHALLDKPLLLHKKPSTLHVQS